ncbi:3-dehydroquinate synthase [Faunimonas pinastri]|uniref:3-dehydroquinate synthase n=1 Tax=Faunimonas pinastri TaxID=1855383 RepID=A0A1H9C782_9HYPH|nr:3-dehydroquinate synthase [Faunimonas pinastri]SEP97056.1 3-dehydroquinate synthase [Faunimonas pinastri]
MTSQTIRVELGTRSYDILIGEGLLAQAGERIAAVLPGARVALVTDENVARIHLETVSASLERAGIGVTTVVVPAGEASKKFDRLQEVVETVVGARLERGDAVVALGGGVIGDLAGFAAAIVRRGMRFVQIPTTLLAQVDSSVGGKTGINSRHGKNLVGAFYQPQLVLAATDALDTLPRREFAAGYAEVAKYGLIGDAAFFAWLEANWQDVFSGGPARTEAIARSCQAKADTVAADERETGERALLNLGHTFGHALEAACGYDADRLVHGEGVAIGTALAHRFSVELGLCPAEDAERVERHLQAVGLPTRISDIPGGPLSADELMTHIGQDKKVKRGRLTFILTHGIGRSFIADDVSPERVRDFLQRELST